MFLRAHSLMLTLNLTRNKSRVGMGGARCLVMFFYDSKGTSGNASMSRIWCFALFDRLGITLVRLAQRSLVDRCNMHIFQSIRNQTLQKIEVRNFSFLRSLILQILACRIRNHRTSHFQKSTSPLILSNDSPFASPCLFTILI
jgi:hypothetical protein